MLRSSKDVSLESPVPGDAYCFPPTSCASKNRIRGSVGSRGNVDLGSCPVVPQSYNSGQLVVM